MRLIDAYKIDIDRDCYDTYADYIRAFDTINEAPTVDAVPVRHGQWIKEFENEDGRNLRCSECRMVFYVGKGRDGNFCPNCGAKMHEPCDDCQEFDCYGCEHAERKHGQNNS